MRERAADLAPLLKDANTHVYVCGLKAWRRACSSRCAMSRRRPAADWPTLGATLKREGRLHFETY